MKAKTNKKLALGKSTIANLAKAELKVAKGGDTTIFCTGLQCPPDPSADSCEFCTRYTCYCTVQYGNC